MAACLLQDGALGRNRTTDTRIFNPLLTQLSYLGKRGAHSVKGRVLNPRAPCASSNLKGCALSGLRTGFEKRVPAPLGDPKQSVHRWLEAAPV